MHGAGSDAVGHGAPQSRTSRDAVSEYEGRRVQIHGLAGRPELNGRLGWVRHYVQDKQRYEVAAEGQREFLLLRAGNLNVNIQLPDHIQADRVSRIQAVSQGQPQAPAVTLAAFKHAQAGLHLRVLGFVGNDPLILDARCKEAHGATLLMAAAGAGEDDPVMTLLANCAARDLQDDDGNTALHHAAQCGAIYYNLFDKVEMEGGDVWEIMDSSRGVQREFQRRGARVARLLLEQSDCIRMPNREDVYAVPGADATLRNVAGQTPLELARTCKNADAIHLLETEAKNRRLAAARDMESALVVNNDSILVARCREPDGTIFMQTQTKVSSQGCWCSDAPDSVRVVIVAVSRHRLNELGDSSSDTTRLSTPTFASFEDAPRFSVYFSQDQDDINEFLCPMLTEAVPESVIPVPLNECRGTIMRTGHLVLHDGGLALPPKRKQAPPGAPPGWQAPPQACCLQHVWCGLGEAACMGVHPLDQLPSVSAQALRVSPHVIYDADGDESFVALVLVQQRCGATTTPDEFAEACLDGICHDAHARHPHVHPVPLYLHNFAHGGLSTLAQANGGPIPVVQAL